MRMIRNFFTAMGVLTVLLLSYGAVIEKKHAIYINGEWRELP